MPPASDPERRRLVLVATTVHHADDVRISRKLVPTLATRFDVVHASRPPGPSVATGARWEALPGGRLVRWLRLARRAWFGRWDVLVLHDPETLPIGWVARLRGPVVFDLHERLPDQLAHKPWVPAVLRGPVRWFGSVLLGVSGRLLHLTVAERGYLGLLRRPAPVFSNLPRGVGVIAHRGARVGAVYVGDVTEARGVADLVEAGGRAGVPVRVVGPVAPGFEATLRAVADRFGTQLTLHGRVPHEQAMALVGTSAVGVSPLHDLPNYRWSPPTKLYEYLVTGIPVVASDLPATREVAEGIDTVTLVPPGDVAALAEALLRVVDDPALAERATADAPAHTARWSWDDEAVLAFYSSLSR